LLSRSTALRCIVLLSSSELGIEAVEPKGIMPEGKLKVRLKTRLVSEM